MASRTPERLAAIPPGTSVPGSPSRRPWLLRLAWLPIPILLMAMIVLWAAGPRTEYEADHLKLLLNLATRTLACLFIVVLVGRSFLVRGEPGVLLLGCGVAIWGTAGFVGTSMTSGDANLSTTITNVGAWLSALCYLASAVCLVRPKTIIRARELWLGGACTLALGAVGLLTLATFDGWLPKFFEHGHGTFVRYLVLGSGAVMGVVAAALLRGATRSASSFWYWYSCALLLIASGLLGMMISSPNTLSDWGCRATQYLGGVYLVIAAIASVRESGVWQISLEASLRESEDRFRSLFERSPDAVFLTTPDTGQVHNANPAACAMFGMTVQELCGLGRGIIDPQDSRLAPALEERNRTGQARAELTCVRKNGQRFAAEVTSVIVPGNRSRSFVIVRDITDRKRAEEALARQAELIDLSPDAIIVRKLDGTVTFWSRGAEALYGWSRDEAIGQVTHALLGTKLPRPLTEIIAEVQRQGRWSGELVHHSRDGREVVVQSFWLARRDAKGQIAELLESNVDITERKHAEAELTRISSLLTEGQQIAHVGSFEYMVETKTTVWSEEEFRIYGLDPQGPSPAYEEMLAKCYLPEDAALLNDAFSKALSTGGVYELEHRIIRPGGEIRWVHDRARPHFDAAGKLIRYVGATLDITDRKLAEEEQDRLASINQLALGAASMVAWEYDPATGRVSLTENAPDLLAIPQGQKLEHSDVGYSMIHPDDVEHHRALVTETVKTAGSYVSEYRQVRGDEIVWIEERARAVADGSGKTLRLVGITQNVTQRKRAEEKLRESEERFRVAQELSPDGFSILRPVRDSEGRIVDFTFVYENAAIARMNGTDPAAVVGRRISEFLPAHSQSPFHEAHAHVADTGETCIMERKYDAGDIPRPTWFRVVVVRTGQDIAILSQDITERKQAEETLRQTMAELQRSNKELEQFAYIASHDLQEPLRQVVGFGDLLRERYRDKIDQRGQQYMGFMIEGAQRMSALVRSLLEYSRVGRQDQKAEPVPAGQALNTALANLRATMEESAAVITHDPLPTVLAEPVLLGQLFQNLIGNALKFRREGVQPEIHVGCRPDGGTCTFWVKDNGIGIREDLHEKAFVIFQRVHGQDKYAGTGIGLAICKKIVEHHGGRIWVESKVGEGSTFFFTMLAAPEAQA